MSDARTALLAILSSLQYLSCQGLAIRGSTDEDSNLIQLLHLRAQDIPELRSWLARKENKWLSHDILNEMTEIMAHDVLRTLIEEIKCEFFSAIMDETADISVREQVSICFRVYTITHAIQSRLWCWIVFFFPFSSYEPFALGCIDNNSPYASPVCVDCVFVKESVCVCACVRACWKEHTGVYCG